VAVIADTDNMIVARLEFPTAINALVKKCWPAKFVQIFAIGHRGWTLVTV